MTATSTGMTGPITAEVRVTISAPTGSGKSAIYGEIVIALTAIGVPIIHADPAAWHSECQMTHADWESALDLYKPTVIMAEVNESRLATRTEPPARGEDVAWELDADAKLLADLSDFFDDLRGDLDDAEEDGGTHFQSTNGSRWTKKVRAFADRFDTRDAALTPPSAKGGGE